VIWFESIILITAHCAKTFETCLLLIPLVAKNPVNRVIQSPDLTHDIKGNSVMCDYCSHNITSDPTEPLQQN